MSFFLFIILAILVWFAFKAITFGVKIHRNVQDLRDIMSGRPPRNAKGRRQQSQQQQRSNAGHQQAGNSGAPAHKKRIDPNVGEYVEYQEISCNVNQKTTTDDNGTERTRTVTEQQVVDVEWEDL